MGRYGIIDLEKLEAWDKYYLEIGDAKSLSVLVTLKIEGTILSPEETEQKFKEVFDSGYDLCSYHNTAGLESPSFDEFKKTL